MVFKGKNRSDTNIKRKSKVKNKRWRKGHSSESNPSTKEHRKAAKGRFFVTDSGQSDLTTEALQKHNQYHNDGDDGMSESIFDAETIGGRTTTTWATNFTDCTNKTFSQIHRYLGSNSATHREILAVLAAVTEVIKAQGGKETETEYFAALMSTLETVDTIESLVAVSYLLSLVIKRVPESVLRSKFSQVSTTLMDILASYMNDDNANSLLRSLIKSLAVVLRAQDHAAWSNSSTMQVFNGLLLFITHPKPKVRKIAHHSLCAILRGSCFMTKQDPPPYHPAASATAKYCIQQIEQHGGKENATATMHTLDFLRGIIAQFPHNSLKSTCETILRVMTLSNVMVTSISMKTLHGMFLMEPSSQSLPPELNAQLITALYDYQPSENDVQPSSAWFAVLEKAYLNLAKLKFPLCLSHMPRMFSHSMACLRSEKTGVALFAAASLKTLLLECFEGQELQASNPSVIKLISAISSGLSYQYHANWDKIIGLLGDAYKIFGKLYFKNMAKSLVSMCELRDSHGFPYRGELDQAMGKAVLSFGPRLVLEAVPLQITGENDDYNFPRSWLLPVFRDHIAETELAFFASYFLPLAIKLKRKSQEHGSSGRKVEEETYQVLQEQIWSLLPGFCTRPTDLVQSFQSIAKVLGTALNERPELRHYILSSIRKLVIFSSENEESREAVAKFAKNFLPILFNIYLADQEGNSTDKSRLAAYETIKVYLQITDSKMMKSFFDMSIKKMEESDSSHKRNSLLDLTLAMIPYIEQNRLIKLYSYVKPNLENPDHSLQKKSYRVLEELCSCKSSQCSKFVSSSLSEFQDVLLNSLSSSGPASKGPRLRCLVNIFQQLEDAQPNFMEAVIPEAILCTRETGERARKAAFLLLTEMCKAMIRWSPETDKKDVLQQYIECLLAGLAGNSLLVTTTTLSITHVLVHFKEHKSDILLKKLLDKTCELLRSKTREIVLGALGLLRVLLIMFSDSSLAGQLEILIKSLTSMKEDNRHHFRFKAKEVFTRLIKKFGYKTILSMTPNSMHKMLNNINKTLERTKRQAKERKSKNDEDDDEEDEVDMPSKPGHESIEELLRDSDSEIENIEDEPKQKKKVKSKKDTKAARGAAWLAEGAHDEDIVDFLDPSVSKKVLATKPGDRGDGNTRMGGIKHGFKSAPDGRLIIHDEEEKQQKQSSKSDPMIDDLEELFDTMDARMAGKKIRKRKHTALDEMNDLDDSASMKYQTGGIGIHRTMGEKRSKTETKPEAGREYKAKKAKGDMKKKGKQDPYAYLPLDTAALNRRKRKQAAGQFSHLLKGAKKGVQKGKKLKSKKMRK